MSPQERKIQELEKEIKLLKDFMMSFDNASQISPLHAKTIQTLAGAASLNSLSDVTLSSPTNGQVLKYNGTNWANAADAT